MPKVKDYRFSFRQKDGGVQIILSYKDALGKWRQKSRQGFPNLKAAKSAKEELREAAEKEAGLTRDKELARITLSTFLKTIFFRDRPEFSYSSKEIYISTVDSFWRDIADKPIKEITEADVINIINERRKTHKSSTVNMRISVLKSILNYALNPYNIIASSPLDHLRRVHVNKKHEQRPALTEEQLQYLFTRLKEKRYQYYVMACISAYSGLRAGEVLGLSWEDIDFTNLTISVKKQYNRNGEKSFSLKRLKTKNSYRTIPIPVRLASILTDWRQDNTIRMDGLVFPPKPSTYNQYNQMIVRILPGFSSHTLRHTYATNLIRNGADIRTVAALLGDTVEMAMKIYVNYTEDMRSAAADLVAKIF